MQSRALRNRGRSTAGRSPKSDRQAVLKTKRRGTPARPKTGLSIKSQDQLPHAYKAEAGKQHIAGVAAIVPESVTDSPLQLPAEESPSAGMRSATDGQRSASRKHWKGSGLAAQRRPQALSPRARHKVTPCSSRTLHLHAMAQPRRQHLCPTMSRCAVESDGRGMRRRWHSQQLTSAFARVTLQEHCHQVAQSTQSTATCQPRRLSQVACLRPMPVRLWADEFVGRCSFEL